MFNPRRPCAGRNLHPHALPTLGNCSLDSTLSAVAALLASASGRIASLLLLCLAAMLPALAQEHDAVRPLLGHTPPQLRDGAAILVGHYSPEQKLRLVLAIQPPHLAEEEQLIEEINTPGSPEFHHFLSPAEWNARFAPSAQDEQKVVDWALSQGLTVTNRFANRLIVDLEAPAGVIEKTFGVTINQYRVGADLDFSNDRDPLLPASLHGIVYSVQGMNSIQRMRADQDGGSETRWPDYVPGPVHVVGESIRSDSDGSYRPHPLAKPHPELTRGLFDPRDIYSSQAYDYNALQALGHCCNPNHIAGGSPVESSIAIATAGNFSNSDVNGFLRQFPYLAANITQVNVNGYGFISPSCCGTETTLDTESTTATSNGFGSSANTAHIWVYAGWNSWNSTFTDVYNHILSDNNARVLSVSWGAAEGYGVDTGTMDSWHAIFDSMAGQGWTMVVATGDQGYTTDCAYNSPAHRILNAPGSDPEVLAVGGTQLFLNSDGTYSTELAWAGSVSPGSCQNNNGGSTGGQSAHWPVPSYQTGMSNTSRAVPDMALNAFPQQIYYYNGALRGIGGTSIATPEVAGFFAQENAYLLYIGSIIGPTCGSGVACAPLGVPNFGLYHEAQNPSFAPHYPLYDILGGCVLNDAMVQAGIPSNCATAGYDYATGWGTANMLQLAWSFNHWVAGDLSWPVVAYTGPTTGRWYNFDQRISWTITDTTDVAHPPIGVAGYTALWDLDPGDPVSEVTPGTGNSYYSGPQTLTTTGSLHLSAAGGQGCHTVHIRAWDNSGVASPADQGYGPVCYDTAPPITQAVFLPRANLFDWHNAPVGYTLTATDPGIAPKGPNSPGTASGVTATYVGLDNAGCSAQSPALCTLYVNPVMIQVPGKHKLNYFSMDKAGNIEAQQSIAVNIDMKPPTTSASLSRTKKGTYYKGPVTVTLKASDDLSGVYYTLYQINNGSVQGYAKPFQTTQPGTYQITFYSTDKAGNVEKTEAVGFVEQ